MVDKKISELPELLSSNVSDGDWIVVTDSSTNTSKKLDFSDLYHNHNIVGTVSQSGGTPTGAVIERGSNVNGEYVRFADGTQSCWATLTASFDNGPRLRANWTFPADFDGAPCVGNTRGSADTATPSNGEIQGNAVLDSVFSGSATLDLYRIIGTTDFQSGDELTLYVTAVGRWFT